MPVLSLIYKEDGKSIDYKASQLNCVGVCTVCALSSMKPVDLVSRASAYIRPLNNQEMALKAILKILK